MKHKKMFITLISIILAVVILVIVYNVHMHYDIEEHVSYNIEDMDAEGRSYTDASVVYMTKDISSEGLIKIYETLNASPEGKVAIKLSTGEAGNPNHLSPDLIKELVQSVDGTIVECNTA